MGNPVVDAIMGATSDPHLRASMLMGTKLESSWNPNAVGDSGWSFGPYQIYLKAHPAVTPQQAKDPVWSTNYMMPSYKKALGSVSQSLWSSNPALAAATVAFKAERPKVMYASGKISSSWPDVQKALNGQSVAGPVTGTDNTVGGGSAPGSDFLGIQSAITDMQNDFIIGIMKAANFVLFFAAVLFGGSLMLAGFILLFRQTSVSANASNIRSALVAASPARILKKG